MKDSRPQGPSSELTTAFPAPASQRSSRPSCASALLCSVYAVCIVGTLLVYGLWQERIMSQPYGDVDKDKEDDYFTFSILLVLFSRVVGLVFALVMVIVMRESLYCQAPLWKYSLISVFTVVASICQFEALKYVSFVMQILGKSFKIVPLMLWGASCTGKRYRVLDWMVAFMVTGGVVWFMLSGNFASEHSAGGNTWWGLGLLLSFIVLDGFTSTFQENLFSQHRTSKYNQMLHINLTSVVLSLASLLLMGNAKESLEFCQSHPVLYQDASIMSISAVVAQWFIYAQVQDYGGLAFVTTMNVRQVASVLASYLAYGHSITAAQIGGLSIVFAALGIQSCVGCLNSQEESRPLLTKGDSKASQSSSTTTTAILLKRSGLAGCMPCVGNRGMDGV